MISWKSLEPRDAAELMRGYERPWWIGGGWAIDLFLGRTTREHADVDVVVLRDDQELVRQHLRGWDLQVAHEGTLTPWRGQRLELPVHTIWARPSAESVWELELLLMETTPERWHFRRDPRISLELDRVGLERDGIPYLVPEILLLYKSKGPRERDEQDLSAVIDVLPAERRRWLLDALRRQDARHPWLSRLDAERV